MVILGGSGSQPGVVLGAILVNVLLQLLQNPSQARVLFYLLLVLGVARDVPRVDRGLPSSRRRPCSGSSSTRSSRRSTMRG